MSQIKLKFDHNPKTSRGTKFFRAGLFLIFLLLVSYFVVSSSWFLQAVIIPRVGNALNSKLTVGDLELRPFNELTLTQVKLTPIGTDPLFEARRVHVRYQLLSILRGNIVVEEVVLEDPVINIVENIRGTSNLDALVGKPSSGKPAAKPATPPQLNFKSVSLRNAVVRHTRSLRNGDKVTTELDNINLAIKDIKNGGSGTLTLSAAMTMNKITIAPATSATLQALLNGDLSFALHEDLQPASVKGLASFSVGRATGAFADLAGLIAKLDCDMSPSAIKQFALQFTKAGNALGRVQVSGPFDTGKTEGKLKLEVMAIDRQVLNLLGARRGIDFGTTTVNGATDITIAQTGRMISLAGRVDVAQLQTVQQGKTSPTVNLTCLYDFTLDRVGNSLLLKSINLNGTQNQQPLVNATLSNPLTIAFGDTINAADASLDFSLNGLNLADWQSFAPVPGLSGLASARGKLFSKDGGKRLSLEIEEQVTGAAFTLATGPVSVEDISFKGTINHTATGQTVDATLVLVGIRTAENPGNPLQVAMGLDAAVSGQVLDLRECKLKLTPTARAKNELAFAGQVDLSAADAITGNLKLTAESLDVTGYYDLFAGKTTTTATNTPAPAKPVTNQEPPAVNLPFENFTIEAAIGRFYLREVDAADFQTKLLLNASQVVLNPFRLTLNSAPISATADLDLSSPGYKYAITFSADGVPIEPLANSFSSTYQGQAKGTLIAKLDLKGAGITGRNLRTNLVGTADFNFTNANIQIVGPKLRAVLAPVSLMLSPFGVPDLLRSPLDHVTAQLNAGEGKITMATFVAQSPVFRAESSGSIPIANVLNDSPLNQPVEIALTREVAAKIGIANTPTNEPYAKLPTFVHLNGTLGKPTAKTDKSALGSVVATGIGTAILKNVDGETAQKFGGALNALGGLLGNNPAATNAPPAPGVTNTAGTNSPAKPNLIDAIRGLR